jgi:hypothetical protein
MVNGVTEDAGVLSGEGRKEEEERGAEGGSVHNNASVRVSRTVSEGV